jgi:hypothetical protein
MDSRENWLRAIEYRHPQWIPCWVDFAPIAWRHYRGDLERMLAEHPKVAPGFEPGRLKDFNTMPVGYRKGELMTDKWGCKRLCLNDGIAGLAVSHPLADWRALAAYRPPDPLSGALDEITQGHWGFLNGHLTPLTWPEADREFRARRARGELVIGDGEKLLDRLYMLRGFENLMVDFATEPPELERLIAMVERYELKLIDHWLSLDVDAISFHTDFATQTGLMISPKSFRKYLVPLFTSLFQTCRRAQKHVILSSDGVTVDVAEDLRQCGVTMHDPQLGPNTAQAIARAFKGRMCVVVDLDQQRFPFMKAGEMRDQVKEVIDTISLPEGGLMIRANFNDTDTPLAIVEELLVALERQCWS